MDLNAIGIPLTFVLLATLGLWFIILGGGHWWIKIAFISLVLYFSVAMWSSLSSLSGWATQSSLPPKFILHWTLVSEPSKINFKDKGAIYFWTTEVDEAHVVKKKEVNYFLQPFVSKKSDSEPRVHRIPYSEKLHQELMQVMQKIRQGKTVVGSAKSGKLGEEGGEGGDGDGKGKGKGRNGKGRDGSMSQEQEFMFYDLPPFKMPEKEPNNF